MDLFNRKKVKDLEREILNVREVFERDRGELIAYKKMANGSEKTISQLFDENQKLIKWIENILREFGTIDAREQHISIPIYKNHKPTSFGSYNDGEFIREREYIEIPSITIIKMG